MPSAEDLEALHRSDQHVVRTVDSLTDEEWAAPSLLPRWSRAHVIAHLALNAEAFAGALEGLADGAVVPMYSSDQARDEAIAALAGEDSAVVRERFFAATEHLRRIVEELNQQAWAGKVLRLPAGPEWPAEAVITARRREVEIHHADLGVRYSHRDWPTDFSAALLDQACTAHAGSADSPDLSVHATDLDRTWSAGAPTPLVSGGAADLAWWLIGRGDGAGLSSDSGPLPLLGPWQQPAKR